VATCRAAVVEVDGRHHRARLALGDGKTRHLGEEQKQHERGKPAAQLQHGRWNSWIMARVDAERCIWRCVRSDNGPKSAATAVLGWLQTAALDTAFIISSGFGIASRPKSASSGGDWAQPELPVSVL
jgi:hypothetical protein